MCATYLVLGLSMLVQEGVGPLLPESTRVWIDLATVKLQDDIKEMSQALYALGKTASEIHGVCPQLLGQMETLKTQISWRVQTSTVGGICLNVQVRIVNCRGLQERRVGRRVRASARREPNPTPCLGAKESGLYSGIE